MSVVVFRNQEIESPWPMPAHPQLSDARFERCTFSGWTLRTKRTDQRPTARRIVAKDIRVIGGSYNGLVLDDVEIEGLRSSQLVTLYAPLLRHVTLRGKIDRMMIHPNVQVGVDPDPAVVSEFARENAREYAKIDWALDISEASFIDFVIRGGVPAKLIRRDPETQMIVEKANLFDARWRNIDLSGTYWPDALEDTMNGPEPEALFVAPKRDRDFKRLLEGLQKLRGAGLAK